MLLKLFFTFISIYIFKDLFNLRSNLQNATYYTIFELLLIQFFIIHQSSALTKKVLTLKNISISQKTSFSVISAQNLINTIFPFAAGQIYKWYYLRKENGIDIKNYFSLGVILYSIGLFATFFLTIVISYILPEIKLKYLLLKCSFISFTLATLGSFVFYVIDRDNQSKRNLSKTIFKSLSIITFIFLINVLQTKLVSIGHNINIDYLHTIIFEFFNLIMFPLIFIIPEEYQQSILSNIGKLIYLSPNDIMLVLKTKFSILKLFIIPIGIFCFYELTFSSRSIVIRVLNLNNKNVGQ